MDGILDMDNNYIQNVRTPFSDGDASNKKYILTMNYQNRI